MTQTLFDGVKVVEFGVFMLAPLATAILSDLGAEVIKIENFKSGGDPSRFNSDIQGQPCPFAGEISVWFQYFNRNKKSVGIDVSTQEGREILNKIIEKADVFVANFDARAIDKLKVDYQSLKEINPRLIYCQCSGYGIAGPDRHKPGFDAAAWWARSGMMDRMVNADGLPQLARPGMGDSVVAPGVAGAIASALYYREKTGIAQKVDINLYHFAVWGLPHDIGTALHQGVNLGRTDRKKVKNALWNIYKTKDERWVLLIMPQTDLYWPGFCAAIGRPEWENDPRFDSHAKRTEQNEYLISALDEIMSTKTVDEWEALAQQHDLIMGRMQTPLEVTRDPQAWENGFFEKLEFQPGSPFTAISVPFKFSETPGKITTSAPELGQHTEEILLELGYSWDSVSHFKQGGTII